jgi:hypothetical protein
MISWIDFENDCIQNTIYTINNNADKHIVFFGNCHIAPTGFFLNVLTNKQYNIHFIISWLFEKNGLQNFDMNLINKKIQEKMKDADIFLYHEHHRDFGIHANSIKNFLKPTALSFILPNFQLSFHQLNSDVFHYSLNLLKHSIETSNFKEFLFIYDNIKSIQFFNTDLHPTHFILFLLAKSIKFKINKMKDTIGFQSYYAVQNRNQFKNMKQFVELPGFIPINSEINRTTDIDINSEHFD